MLRLGGLGLGLIPQSARPNFTDPPVNSVLPSIVGILTQGQTLTANPGSWSGLPSGSFTYQWQRSGVNIGGATASTYVAAALDVAAGASALTVEVTATNDIGSTMAESAGVTIAAPLAISGTPPDGVVGVFYDWTPDIEGGHAPYAVALTGTLQAGLANDTTTGRIYGTPSSSGTASSLNLTATDDDGLTDALGVFDIFVDTVPDEDAPENTVLPVASLPADVNSPFTVTNGTWTGSPTSYAYQWKRAGVNISGETANTYDPDYTLDIGANITCAVTAANAAGSASATSAAVQIGSAVSASFVGVPAQASAIFTVA